jgi:hypothetical protein
MIGFDQYMPHWTEIRENPSFVAEIKYLVPLAIADDVRQWCRRRFVPDPNGAGPAGDTYQTTSLYFDTPSLDVFYRRGSFGRSKYRIRRYNAGDTLFLERKLKKRDLVSKRRSIIPWEDLSRLDAEFPTCGWPGFWFHRRILARELDPYCQIAYRRTALMSQVGSQKLRVTLDLEIRACTARGLRFQPASDGCLLLPEHAILELKQEGAQPQVFRGLEAEFALQPVPVSKYRLAVESMTASEPALKATA